MKDSVWLLVAQARLMCWRADLRLHSPDYCRDKVHKEDNVKHIASRLAALALVLAVIMVVALASTATPVSAAQAGPAFATSYANIPDRGTFNQPHQGRASDDSYAVETGADNCSVSYFGFGFSLPSSNIIDGIVVTVEGQVSSGSNKGLDVSLSYDNGTSWTATQNTGVMTTSDNFYTVGAADDNWGYSSWTPAVINSDYFRVRLDVSGTDGNIKIDSTQAAVYYREGTTTSVASSASPSSYGDSVTFTATVTRSGGTGTPTGTVDFRDGGLSIGSGTLSWSDGTATATLSTASLAAVSHTITATYNGDSNFTESTSSPMTQVVNQRNITVTADSQGKVYGDSDPALTYQITTGTLVGGDGFSGALTRVSGEAVGTYSIQQGSLALSSDYNLTYVANDLTVTVRHITAAADPQSKVYGDPDPALTYGITSGSLVRGDGFTGTLTRAAGELAGTYAIQQGSLALSSNYDLTYEGASLRITPRPITIVPPAPTLDGIGPNSGHPGETLNIIIDGIDFAGATDIYLGPDVTVNSFLVEGPTRITASITINPGASPGHYDVTVTTPSGDGTLTEAFGITGDSPVGSGSWWLWFPVSLLALAMGILLFLLFRRGKKETLWDVMARHAYS